MSIKKTLLKNSFFNMSGYLYLLFASLFSISLFLNNLGKEIFGMYILLASFTPLSSVFDLGVSLAIIKELADDRKTENEKTKIWQSSFYVFLIQASLLGTFFFFTIYYLLLKMPIFSSSTLTINPILISSVIGATIFINHINNAILNITQANHRFDVYNSKSYIVGSANTILSAVATYYTKSLALIFLIQLIFQIVSVFFTISYGQKIFGRSLLKPKYNKAVSIKLLSFGIKNFIGTLAGQVEAQISKFFLGFLSSAQSITSFNIPQNIYIKGAGIVSQLAQVFFPLSASLVTRERIIKLRRMYLVIQFMVFLSGIVVILFAYQFGYNFLVWWLKDIEVVNLTYPVLKILSFYYALISLTPLPTALLQGIGYPQIPSFFAVLTTMLEAILMAFLVPKYQEVGAAYSFLLTLLITSPIFLIYTSITFEKYLKKTLSLGEKTTPKDLA